LKSRSEESVFRTWVYNMFSDCWVMLVSLFSLGLLAPSTSQTMDTCSASQLQFALTFTGGIPGFCLQIQHNFNDVSYRIDFTQPMIDNICSSLPCVNALKLLILPCRKFVSILRVQVCLRIVYDYAYVGYFRGAGQGGTVYSVLRIYTLRI